jgi:hypothetical protein
MDRGQNSKYVKFQNRHHVFLPWTMDHVQKIFQTSFRIDDMCFEYEPWYRGPCIGQGGIVITYVAYITRWPI